MKRWYVSLALVVLIASMLGISCDGMSFSEEGRSDSSGDLRYRAANDETLGGQSGEGQAAERTVDLLIDPARVEDPGARPAAVPQERLRIYSANLDLGVTSVERARDEIVGITQDSGGYVETSRDDYIVVRVPAESFGRVLTEIETVGTLRSRSVRTADVTDQFFDLERRLAIALAARDRLNALLERTNEPDEQVAILRDIRRLTEEIERLRASFESLAQHIAYSRITVQLTAMITQNTSSRRRIPFPWIARLDPLSQTTKDASFRVPVEVPESFALFEEGRFVQAEAADGTSLRIGAVPNEPHGDGQFWERALEYHLGPFYLRVKTIESGPFSGVLLESMDRQPYHYAVVVAVHREELVVAEIFYPSTATLEARSDEIEKMLREVEL